MAGARGCLETLVGRVILPEMRSVVGFGDGVVYLARTDEFDLQWLEKHSLERELER